MLKQEVAKRSISLLLAGTLLSISVPAAFAQQHLDSHTSLSVTQQQSYMIPQGTNLTLRSTSTAPVGIGQVYSAELVSPVVLNGVTVIPAGSQVRGNVISVNDVNNTMDVQFHEVSTVSGRTIPITTRVATVNRLQGNVYQQQQIPVATTDAGVTLFPTITFGRPAMTPGAKIVAGTLGGAAFGGATGALTGLVFPAVYGDDIHFNEGTGALRGLAWGSLFGGGLGLVSGLVAAAADRDDVSVTTVRSRTAVRPMTNITTGSLQEIPVSMPVTTTTGYNSDYVIILDQPATVRF
jgi:hypothetical protein